MIIGAKERRGRSQILEERSQKSIEYALNKILKSELAPAVKRIYLYGSCARKEQMYGSDVDLMVELKEGTDLERYQSEITWLRGQISPVEMDLPEVDLHIAVGESWRKQSMVYYQNVLREGIVLWEC